LNDKTELTERQQRISDFRYGVIAELVFSHLESAERSRLIAAKAARKWTIPYSGRTTLTASCIRKWVNAYQIHGRQVLVPKVRKDTGVSRVLTDADKELILKLLEEKPQLCATVAVRVLQKEGKLVKNISRSALSRFLIASGAGREDRVRCRSKDQVLRYNFEMPLECVQVDAMHCFQVPDFKGGLSKAILIAFIDDATRRIVYSRLSFTENSLEFERGIYQILSAHGRIRKLYTDNGSTFVSDQTQRILDSLGIPLVHSRPGIPKGRGKIERFFRTVRTQFEATLNPADIRGIHDLDQRWRTWLESEYHRTGHSGLQGKTPLEAWLAGTRHILRMDPTVDLHEAFCHQLERSVGSDATVSLNGVDYEVPSVLCKRRVKLRVNPLDDLPLVRVWFDGRDYGTARRVDERANARTKRIMDSDAPSQTALRSSAAIGGQ
jgi:hypothetical protein